MQCGLRLRDLVSTTMSQLNYSFFINPYFRAMKQNTNDDDDSQPGFVFHSYLFFFVSFLLGDEEEDEGEL